MGSNPTESMSLQARIRPLKWETRFRLDTTTDAPSRETADGKGSTNAPPGRFDDDRVYVRSRRPLNSIEFVERQ